MVKMRPRQVFHFGAFEMAGRNGRAAAPTERRGARSFRIATKNVAAQRIRLNSPSDEGS
jgi:hypothetical protein